MLESPSNPLKTRIVA